MKRYSDNISPSRWKRICPPADDSDTDTEESLDLSFDLLSELWEGRPCNHCLMPNSSCSCSPRRTINSSNDLPMILPDSEPPRTSTVRPSQRSQRANLSVPVWTPTFRFRSDSPQEAGPSTSDDGRSVAFRASTSIETYIRPSRESLSRERSPASSASRRRLNEMLNHTSLLFNQELMNLSARSEPGNNSPIVQSPSSPPSINVAPTCSPPELPSVESLRRDSACSAITNDPSPPEAERLVNKELDDLHTRLLSMIECPVCLEPISPPIHQCRRGHLVCAKCKSQLNQCPTCRDKLCETRNWAVERIAELLKYPCRNSGSGCTVTTLLSTKAAHEALCPFRPYSCLFRTCSWTGFQPELLPHLRSIHPLRFLEGNRHEIDVELNSPTLFITDWAISCFDRVFRFNVFQHIPNSMFYASAYLIGGSGFATSTVALPSDFTYTVTVSGSQGRKYSFTRETHPDTIRTTQLCHSEDCFVIRGDKLENYAYRNGAKLRLLVELQRSQNSVV